MPEINNIISYDDSLSALIKAKLEQLGSGFDYNNWSDEDLEGIRSFIRSFYRREQKGLCAYCRNPVSLVSASNCHVEHVVPKSKHVAFIFEPKNLCVICADCNQIKREQETLNTIADPLTLVGGKVRKRYPKTSGGFKIFHPHFDRYNDHILILGEFYVDKTPKGHFTIGACNLNRRLREFGWPQELYSDADLIELMNSFIGSSDALERGKILKSLTAVLLEVQH